MKRQVAIAKAEPILAAERGQRFHERPGFVCRPQPSFALSRPGERVHQRVGIRRDMQAEMLEIVADIGDDKKIVRLDDPAQTKRELGAADAARERHHKTPAHRKRSSFAGTNEAGRRRLRRGPAQATDKHAGGASSACPIKSEAAAAISSAKPMTLTSSLRPNKSGRPRKSISAGRPAAPIATPAVPRRQGRPKLSLMTTAISIPVSPASPRRSVSALRSGFSGNRSTRCEPSAARRSTCPPRRWP